MENRKTYNASDFERYHSGKMSSSEMHHLEKAALDDPFLAQAVEGFRYSSSPATDMDELMERLNARSRQKRRSLPVYMRYVAAVVIIIGLATLFLKLNDIPKVSREEPVLATVTTDSIAKGAYKIPGNITNSTEQLTSGNVLSEQPTLSDSVMPVAPAPVSSNILANNKENEKTVSKEESGVAKNVSSDLAVNIQTDKSTAYFAGRVIDTSGNPIAFASVTVPGAGGVRADANGMFQLPAIAMDSVSKTTVTAVGYRSVTEELKQNDMAVIKLEPSEKVVSEVVVTSAFNTKKTARSQAASASKAGKDAVSTIGGDSTSSTPVDGWEKFNEYVYDKLKEGYNPATTDKKKGDVVLSFNVDKNGRPTNITVVQSVSDEADAAAIRILQQGPSWKYRGKNKKAKIPIRID